MEVDTKALATVDRLNAVSVVKNADDYKLCGELWQAGRAMMDQISEAYDSIIAAAHKAHKEAVAKKKSFFDPVEAATKRVKRLMSDYDAEQDRLRREEQARLEKEARQIEEGRKLSEALLVAVADPKAADAILNEPIMVAPVIIPKAVPKVEGMSFREIWRFEIVDVNLIPRQYLIPDEKAIGQVVRGLKDQTNIPGVKVYKERV